MLLVEDNPDNRFLVEAFLKAAPVRLDVARDGSEAVEKFSRGSYGLILMDMQMPVMDGFAATREIRLMESSSGRDATPIIALTAGALPEERERCLKAGCNAHIAKPVKKQLLLETIREYRAG